MGRVRVHGADEIAARLMNLGEVTNSTTREAIRQGAEAIRDLSKDYAPRDTGALERAIKIFDEIGPSGRKMLVITIDPSVINRETGKSVEQYATEMHDNYDAYEPGPGTVAKIQAGLDAGGMYIFRAATELEPRIMARVQAAIERALARVNK